MQNSRHKLPQFELKFRLTVDDGWPPVGFEVLPVDTEGEMHTILVPPFFLKGLSVDDVIKCTFDSEGYVENWAHVYKSNRSTFWVHFKSLVEWEAAKQHLLDLGCNIETYNAYKHSAIDVPSLLPWERVDEILGPVIAAGGFVVAPSLRE